MTTSLDMALKKYENRFIMTDFDIDMDEPDSQVCAQFNNFCDIFDLVTKKLVSAKTTHQGLI